jgi:hypothetical protein
MSVKMQESKKTEKKPGRDVVLHPAMPDCRNPGPWILPTDGVCAKTGTERGNFPFFSGIMTLQKSGFGLYY